MAAALREPMRASGSARRVGSWTAAALVAAAAGWALDLTSQLSAGLDPQANAWGATVAALMAWQGFHTVVLLLMAGYLLARCHAGLLTARRHATRDAIALFWLGSALQGVLAIAVVRWMPAWA
jgi:cytochrome c oxidase subunit I+III